MLDLLMSNITIDVPKDNGEELRIGLNIYCNLI